MQLSPQDFDRCLDALLIPESRVDRKDERGEGRHRRTPDDETKIRRGMSLFHRADYRGCIRAMRTLEQEGVEDSRIRAFLSASRAMILGDTSENLRSCVDAVRVAGPVPDVFCALGAVLMRTGDRAGAHAVFQKGLSLDPLHPYLRARLRSMGVRKPPVLRSLPRTHPVNRVLGALRARFGRF